VSKRTRMDIQALRGFAVLLVLLYHAELLGSSPGYLGVDIFFVLSGYLMASLISRELMEGSFSLACCLPLTRCSSQPRCFPSFC
jgi:peptidoglycan/LPS O-acetylase OafA/YrhL